MTAPGVRSRMKHRMIVQRDSAGKNLHNLKSSPVWSNHLEDVPCYAFTQARDEVIDGVKTAIVESLRILTPVADITERDRIVEVKNRAGEVLFRGPIQIDALHRMDTHLEMTGRPIL